MSLANFGKNPDGSKKPITVLSLCDGMSCGHIAFEQAGYIVGKYYASEIKKHAIACTKHNYPDTVHLGDVNKVKVENGVLYSENGEFDVSEGIDAVIFGSPCQTFSSMCMSEWRVGLEDKFKSGLFYECYRVMKEANPKLFLVENVAGIDYADSKILSDMLGVQPVRINSRYLTAQKRDRLYWTNIEGIEQPEDKGIKFADIIESGYVNMEKSPALLCSVGRGGTNIARMLRRLESMPSSFPYIFEKEGDWQSIRIPSRRELERLQGVPEGYTDCCGSDIKAADLLGDGWTIPVIVHILSFIDKEQREKDKVEQMSKVMDLL